MKPIFDLRKKYYYIVDTSYIIYRTANSAFKQYVYQEDILKSRLNPTFDPTIDPEFNCIFEERFKNFIESSIKNIVPFTFNRENFIFAIDCPRKNIWRREIYPEYKLTRDTADHTKDLYDIGSAFRYAYINLIPNYCDEFNAKMVKCNYAEGDDVIAVLVKYLLDKDSDNNVIILSSDKDMVQLYNERTKILSSTDEEREPKKEFMTMTNCKKLEDEITANDFLLFKIMIGDGSDNIPNIKPRLGPKTAMPYVLDKSREKLKALLLSDPNIAKSFKRNKALISMKEIPVEIENLIVENIEEEFEKRNNNKVEKPKEKSIDEIIDEII